MKADNFPQWLSQELKKRDWSIRELGRRSLVSHSWIAKVMRGETEASWDFCAGIAPALGYSPVEMLLIAGKINQEDVIKAWPFQSEVIGEENKFEKLDPLALQTVKEMSTLPPRERQVVFNTMESLMTEIRQLTANNYVRE